MPLNKETNQITNISLLKIYMETLLIRDSLCGFITFKDVNYGYYIIFTKSRPKFGTTFPLMCSKGKRNLQSFSCVSTTVWIPSFAFNEMLKELHKNAMSSFEQILEVIPHKGTPVRSLTSHLTNH